MEKNRLLKCDTCDGTGVYAYDENHTTWCKKCCKHEDGYYQITTDHWGPEYIGKWLCKKCGTEKEIKS